MWEKGECNRCAKIVSYNEYELSVRDRIIEKDKSRRVKSRKGITIRGIKKRERKEYIMNKALKNPNAASKISNYISRKGNKYIKNSKQQENLTKM